jgi:imidazolonepropionase-like amidohydrolase
VRILEKQDLVPENGSHRSSVDRSSIECVYRNAMLLNGVGEFDGPTDILINQHGLIEHIGRNIKSESPSIDFTDLWLMPGVVDCHDHVALSTMDVSESLRTPITLWALSAAENARKTLMGGVTLIRDASGADAGVRTAIERGHIVGPRLLVSTVALTQTGGHVDGFLAGPGIEMAAEYLVPNYPGRPPVVVDGPDEMRKAVRAILRAGADWVKLTTTGGIISEHAQTLVPEFTMVEITIAVEEARRRGKSVMAHAYGGEGATNAIDAGVRSIEHGTFLTEEQLAMMRDRSCWLVPTLSVLYDILRWRDEGSLPAFAQAKARDLEGQIGTVVAAAREAGVRIALGTDFLTREQHGHNLREIYYLKQAGLSAADALLAATSWGAELCGLSESRGRLAPGYVFDAIILDEDPGDLEIFMRADTVSGVFLGGRAMKRHQRFADSIATTVSRDHAPTSDEDPRTL